MLATDLCLSWSKVLNFYENSCIRIVVLAIFKPLIDVIIKYLQLILGAIKIASDYNRWR